MARYVLSPHQSPKGPRPIHGTPTGGSSPMLQAHQSQMSMVSLGSTGDLNSPLMAMPQPSRPMQQVPYPHQSPQNPSSYLNGPPQQFPEYQQYLPQNSSPSHSPHLQPQYHPPQQPAYAPQYQQYPNHRPSLPYQGHGSPRMRPGMFVATAGTEEQQRLYYQDQTNPPTRHKTMKRVKLTNGNLIVDCQVPSQVLQNAEFKTGEEFTHLRYTAATCDPNDFVAQKYTLRQELYGRHTEIFVVMTMYNENDSLFIKTMSSVMKNIAHLCSRTKSRTWGDEGWKKVTVCIVADGRKKCHPRVLTVLGAMGIYQDGIAKNTVNGKETTAHIYEYTTQVMVDPKLGIRGKDRGVVPVQVLFCLKEQNKKKLNSHRWFFNAFASILQPNVCVLLDVGTRPTTTSIYHLWKAFDRDPMIAGACGEIAAELGSHWENIRNPLVATQNFEYKMSNILDKPLESVFGYISVLPGAFSAYRYAALQDYEPNKGPLSSYFKGETMHGAGAGVFEANMYLAEDRILCFELVAKPHCSWLLKYVKAAKAETDVPDTVPELISQRRRWLNGSFFAATYALVNWTNIWKTDHSFTRKLLLQFEFLYNTVSILFSWFSLGNFYLTFYFLTLSADTGDSKGPFGSDPSTVRWVLDIMRNVYLFALIVTFICALGNRPQGSKFVYTLCMLLFAGLMGLMLYMAAFTVVKNIELVAQNTPDLNNLMKAISQNLAFRDIIISLGSTYGVYFLASVMYMDPWHMVTSFVQYMFLLPSFVNILMVYSFCNTHDVSWGTKGDNGPKADLGAAVAKPGVDGGEVELELPMETEGLDEMYDRLLREIVVRPEEKHQSRDAKTKQDDYYKMFRTRLVLLWVFSNCVLVWVVMNTVTGDTTATKSSSVGYLSFIFWSVASLSFIRFLGSVAYLVMQMILG